MVVHDFNVYGITIHPDKTDAPLVVDSNTVLSYTISPQYLQSVCRWHSQVD